MIERLKAIPKTHLLQGIRVIITGCGYTQLGDMFYDFDGKPSHDSLPIAVSGEIKLNIGAATACVLASNGAVVHMISQTAGKLSCLKESMIENLGIADSKIEFTDVDLLNEKDVDSLVQNLPKDLPIYWVQSIGLGAGSYHLKDGNPYLNLENIPLELLETECTTVLKGTHILFQRLLPIFARQKETRIAIISSMSAVRGYSLGATHCASKGAISRYTNAAMLDLWKDRIYITDIRPGAIDTGMYDDPAVQQAILTIDKEYGSGWNNHGIRLAPPVSVGYAIANILSSPAHITSVNLVAQGQFPNEGS